MAKVKINAKDFLDTHIKPIADAIPLGAGTAAYGTLMSLKPPFPPNAKSFGELIDKDFEVDVPGLPGAPALPQVTPIDPTKALGDIAKAIKEAEKTLLDENLSIRTASVDVELTVAVAGAAGATAKFNLEIGPAPSD
jgi:hypothetical protein